MYHGLNSIDGLTGVPTVYHGLLSVVYVNVHE